MRSLALLRNQERAIFTDKQRGVIIGVIPAALATVLGMGGVSLLIPMSALPADTAGSRLAWAMQWALLPILTLMISIMRVANQRFSSPDDIDGSGLTAGTTECWCCGRSCKILWSRPCLLSRLI